MKRALLTEPFTPRSLAGLVAWWDASDPTTLFQDAACATPAAADGDVVGGWRDRFAGLVAGQATAAKKPLLKLGIQNGLSVVRPDAIDDGLVITGLASSSGSYTFYAVTKGRTSTSIYLFDSASGRLILGNSSSPENIGWYDGAWEKSGSAHINVWQILTWVLTSGAGGEAFRNGATLGAAAYTAKALGGAAGLLSDNAANAGFQWGVDLAEFLIYSRAHTPGEQARMTAYLNAKWRVF